MRRPTMRCAHADGVTPRAVFLALVTIAALGGCSRRPVDLAAEAAAIRARSQALAAAEATQNTQAALAIWTADGVSQAVGAPQIEGAEDLRRQYDLFFRFFASGRLKELRQATVLIDVSQSGDLAWEQGINRLIAAGPEGDLIDAGKYLAVWKKVKGQWYLAARSFTSDAPAPVPASSQ